MSRPRIAILGANGQVGAELALLLARASVADVRGVVRAEYGAALLRLADIPFATASFDDSAALARALADCDLVVDLTYPLGQFVEIPKIIARNTRAVMGAMPRGARYLQMSSIMAFGTASGASRLRDHRLPRASYGYIKRGAEGTAAELGRELGIEIFVCRLGQVHGMLQGVSHDYRTRAREGRLHFAGEPDLLTTTVFTNAVADAVLLCARGALEPDRVYTLVSNPQWTLAELGRAYGSLYAPDLEVTYESPPRRSLGGRALLGGLVSAGPARDLLETYVFLRVPDLFVRAKGRFRVRAVRTEGVGPRPPAPRTAISSLTGAVPGALVPGIASSVDATVVAQRVLADWYDALLERCRK